MDRMLDAHSFLARTASVCFPESLPRVGHLPFLCVCVLLERYLFIRPIRCSREIRARLTFISSFSLWSVAGENTDEVGLVN